MVISKVQVQLDQVLELTAIDSEWARFGHVIIPKPIMLFRETQGSY